MSKRETRDKRVNLRLSKRLVNKVEAAARSELRSLNSMFEVIVSEWVAKQRARPTMQGSDVPVLSTKVRS